MQEKRRGGAHLGILFILICVAAVIVHAMVFYIEDFMDQTMTKQQIMDRIEQSDQILGTYEGEEFLVVASSKESELNSVWDLRIYRKKSFGRYEKDATQQGEKQVKLYGFEFFNYPSDKLRTVLCIEYGVQPPGAELVEAHHGDGTVTQIPYQNGYFFCVTDVSTLWKEGGISEHDYTVQACARSADGTCCKHIEIT